MIKVSKYLIHNKEENNYIYNTKRSDRGCLYGLVRSRSYPKFQQLQLLMYNTSNGLISSSLIVFYSYLNSRKSSLQLKSSKLPLNSVNFPTITVCICVIFSSQFRGHLLFTVPRSSSLHSSGVIFSSQSASAPSSLHSPHLRHLLFRVPRSGSWSL